MKKKEKAEKNRIAFMRMYAVIALIITLGFSSAFLLGHTRYDHCALWSTLVIMAVVITLTLLCVRKTFLCYDRSVFLKVSKQQEHRMLFQEETQQLYENIYEINITHNCAASEETQQYFLSLGVPVDTPYDEAIRIIAQRQIKNKFRKGYLATFAPDSVLQAYENNIRTLHYEFMITHDGGEHYIWMRITARIFYWEHDESIRMFVYRQNIDEEKRREKELQRNLRLDSLSGLYNKAATREVIQQKLAEQTDELHAFFIIDIDNFKAVNDQYGHQIGDVVIQNFAQVLKKQFYKHDIVGRIGGDEFVAFMSCISIAQCMEKASQLLQALHYDIQYNELCISISASIGISCSASEQVVFDDLYRDADIALYESKNKGKHCYTIYK